MTDYHDTERTSERLKQQITEVFGKRVASSGDCILLSEEIYTKTSFRVNSNTLRRFFGLVKSEHQPSRSTLHILSQYCGFESYDDLAKHISSNGNGRGSQMSEKDFLDYLVSLFKFTPTKNYSDEVFLGIVKQTVRFLQQHPHLTETFQKAIAKTKNGQDYYFEQFVNIDALASYFGRGNGLLCFLKSLNMLKLLHIRRR